MSDVELAFKDFFNETKMIQLSFPFPTQFRTRCITIILYIQANIFLLHPRVQTLIRDIPKQFMRSIVNR